MNIINRFVIVFVLLFAALSASADRGGFYYNSIKYNAVVHENNVWDITEVYDITFTEPRHGFYRYLPQTFYLYHDVSDDDGVNVDAEDGEIQERIERFTYKVEVLDPIVAGGPYDFSLDDGNYIFKIGDPDEEVTGRYRYIIHYTYVYPDDRRPDYDYVFHTILSTDFNERIEKFYFNLTFDKPLPDDFADNIEIYSGEYGEESNVVDVTLYVDGNTIEGYAKNIEPNHGVTLYSNLPKDYFVGAKKVNMIWHYTFFGLTVLLLILITYYALRSNPGKATKSIEFYPPKGISSAEVGYIIDESSDTVDIVSLIPWFASQGYLKIREIETDNCVGIFKKKKTDLELTKLKDLPDDAPEYQMLVMQLFFQDDNVVRLNSIGERPKTIEKIKKALGRNFVEERKLTTTKAHFALYILLWITSYLTFATNTVVDTWCYDTFYYVAFVWALPFIFGTVMRHNQSSIDLYLGKGPHLKNFILKFAIMAVVAAIYYVLFIEYGAPMDVVMSSCMFVACFLVAELAGRFNVNTQYRLDMMGRLLGFKEFIKTAEKSRLEKLQNDDPHYYYCVLPYAMVFGLTDKWADLFKDINVDNPGWYESSVPLTGYAFTKSLTSNLYSSASNAITTISHDSSSRSGGGGFSGGGGGGGGGGSW